MAKGKWDSFPDGGITRRFGSGDPWEWRRWGCRPVRVPGGNRVRRRVGEEQVAAEDRPPCRRRRRRSLGEGFGKSALHHQLSTIHHQLHTEAMAWLKARKILSLP